MRLATQLGDTWAIILVDSNSTHNFMDVELVRRLNLSVDPTDKLKVIVANGGCLLTHGHCKGVSWSAQGNQFTSDFMILPLRGCDLVLGIQRYFSLGSIV